MASGSGWQGGFSGAGGAKKRRESYEKPFSVDEFKYSGTEKSKSNTLKMLSVNHSIMQTQT